VISVQVEESSQPSNRPQIRLHQPHQISDPYLSISKTGEKPYSLFFSVCHRIPERSIHFHGRPLICYRCAGTYLGFAIPVIYQFIGIITGLQLLVGPLRPWFMQVTGNNILVQLAILVILHLPMAIDGIYQAKNNGYTSNNPLRFLTGFIAGIGQIILLILIGSIGFWILSLF